MSRAYTLVERLGGLLSKNEEGMMGNGGGDGGEDQIVTFIFKGFQPGGIGGAGATPSNKNTADQLRARGLVAGHDYIWASPLKLQIKQSMVDRDILDVIQSEGGFETSENEPGAGNGGMD